MAGEVILSYRVLETVYRSERGDYVGLKCEWPPPVPGGTPRLVFLKTNNPEKSNGRSLIMETNSHRALSGAPGLVPLLNAWMVKQGPCERFYLMTEYSPHGDLMGLLKRHGPLGERDARLVIWQLLQGLDAIHRRGYVHMDIKPSNWLIKENLPSGLFGGIIDFGFAHPIQTLLGGITYKGGGTPGFSAPELDAGLTLALPDRVDIYSAGCFLFFVLTGQHAYDPSYATQLRLHNFHKINGRCSPQALNFLLTLLHPDPMGRPTAAQALVHPWFALLLEEHDIVALSYPPAPVPGRVVMRPLPAAGVPLAGAIMPQNVMTQNGQVAAAAGNVAQPEADGTTDGIEGAADQPTEMPGPTDAVAGPVDQNDAAMDRENDDDYVDEPAIPAEANIAKKRRRVGIRRREVYQNQGRHKMAMSMMLRVRRQKRLGRKRAKSQASGDGTSQTTDAPDPDA